MSIFSIGFNEYVVPASNQAYADLVRYEIQGKYNTRITRPYYY
ncbi:hypothetical protein [Megamonas hypermegale]